MLLWQVFFYAALPAPLLGFMSWAYRGGEAQYWFGFTALGVWGTGSAVLLHRMLGRGFRDEDGAGASARTSGPRAALESLKLPRGFKGLALWALAACMVAFALVSPSAETADFPRLWAAMTAVCLLGTGVGWWVWARGGLRPPSAETGVVRTPRGDREVELTRSAGDGEAERTLRWRIAQGRSMSEALSDIVDAGLLPPVATGERSWVVAVDGEPVAGLTQTRSGSRWWPEPEWLVDPHEPFIGERIVFDRREFRAW